MSRSTELTSRRTFVSSATLAGLGATLPAPLSGEALQAIPKLRLGPGGEILNVQENKAALDQINAAKALTPEQLLKLAALYRDHPVNGRLADHLAFTAMAMIAQSRSINTAMASIEKTQIEWSWWGDAWKAVRNFFTSHGSPCTIKCWFSSLLVEKCPDGKYHVIGVCYGGSF